MPFVAALMAAVSFGLIADRRQSVAGWAAVDRGGRGRRLQTATAFSDFFWTTLILTLAWFFGFALGTRTEQARELRERVEAAERERAIAAERATAEERARIARELHDVVAHSVSVMVVQASGVRRLLKDGAASRAGGAPLGRADRPAGADRDAPYVGRDADAAKTSPRRSRRSPGLQHLDRLIAQVEEAGLPVTLRVEGERPDSRRASTSRRTASSRKA